MRAGKAKVHSSFRQNWEETWNDLIADPNDTKNKHRWWQGTNAHKELESRKLLSAVLPGAGTLMIYFLLRQLRFHRRFASDALALSKANQVVIKALGEEASRFRKWANKGGVLKNELLDWAELLNRAACYRRDEHKTFWRDTLLPYDSKKWRFGDRHLFPVDPYHNMFVYPIVPDPPREVWEAEKVFRSVRYPSNYTSRANLATWLQIRAAVVFKSLLSPNLSLLSASRLVVLFCGCAGLGNLRNDANGKAYLQLSYTQRKLSVIGLYEKLKHYGVDEFPFGGRLGPPNSGGPIAA